MPNTLARNIAALRKSLGDTQARFAERLEVPQSYISKWENHGTEPAARSLARMADLAGVALEQFMDKDWSSSSSAGEADAAPPRRFLGIKPAPQPDIPPTRGASDGDGAITLKRINLGFAMGDGSNLDDYVEEGTVEFDPNLLRAISQSPAHRLLVADGVGDSMQPTLLDSDLLVIDTLQTRLNMTDRIWAIALYGAGAVKRLRPAAGGKLEIISDNTLHEKQIVDAQDVRIIGRVVWSGRRH
ncbi:XRE family transcriptional regulator [Sphingomonas sp. VDB2]|uniref:XRE family transcriptional regulator n=1 Tax=Sphingomonas sp. VDB2 TaxID=3228751 RepID=UPI003A813239